MTTDNPFAPVHSRQAFLETPGVGEVLRRLGDGLGAREPFLLVTADPGVGKTALAHEAVARWDSRVTVAFLAYAALAGAELLEEIIRRFGAEPPDGASRSKLFAGLEHRLAEITDRGQVAMLVVDDAHDLSLEQLEELRLLASAAQQQRRPLEVLLIGLPALEARLDDPALVALRQRVSVRAKLEPLSAAETRRYLHHRIAAIGGDGPTLFSRKTCRDIAARTRGVPRQINALATEALSVARAWGDQTVMSEHVQTAAAALGGFVPSGDVEDPSDSGPEDSPALVAPSRPVAAARAPVVAPAPSAPAPPKTVAPTRAPQPQPSPSAETAVRAPAPSAKPAAPTPAPRKATEERVEEAVTANPTVPASHDPREWVERFVGDKGPIQIGSLARAEATWVPEPTEPGAVESPRATEAPPKPRARTDTTLPRSRSGRRIPMRVATTAALATIVVVSVAALVIRAGNLARSRAAEAAGAQTTAASTRDADPPSSSGATKAGSRTRAGERRTEATTGNSKQPYTLDVGGYADLESALDQRERLQQLTGFEGWVVPSDDRSRPYRIVLGAYRSHARATSAANMLLNSRTLRNVIVVELPPRDVRR